MSLLDQIQACILCKDFLDPRPVTSFDEKSKVLIIGQAPGRKVHESGIPWDDQSGKKLREWLDVDNNAFYDSEVFGIIPMGFCYPGKGKQGDLPPSKICAPEWHEQILETMDEPKIILIGQYAQKYYLGDRMKPTLTETVKNYKSYFPDVFVLPHPSPRNGFWLRRNSWFEEEVVPELRSWILKNIN